MRNTVLAVLLTVFAAACGTTIKTYPTGTIGVEDAVRLYMTNPTVETWLRKTQATPVYFPSKQLWRIDLPDGRIFYNEYREDNGFLYVNQIWAESDDAAVEARLDALYIEMDALFGSDENAANQTIEPTGDTRAGDFD